ncbi:MAG: hypothetical protein ABFQ65_04380 [Nanoarchaeota archaeon]
MEINKDSLENALSSTSFEKKEAQPEVSKMPQVSKEQEVGHHQGALSTLLNERNELVKMIQNVEVVMQAHIKRLEELGVKIEQKKS